MQAWILPLSYVDFKVAFSYKSADIFHIPVIFYTTGDTDPFPRTSIRPFFDCLPPPHFLELATPMISSTHKEFIHYSSKSLNGVDGAAVKKPQTWIESQKKSNTETVVSTNTSLVFVDKAYNCFCTICEFDAVIVSSRWNLSSDASSAGDPHAMAVNGYRVSFGRRQKGRTIIVY